MNKLIVTESSDELISKAEKDVKTVKVLSAQKLYPEDSMYDITCFHATQAVEKLLKAYIIKNGLNVSKTHDIDHLQNIAMGIDNSFANISKDCVSLNEFTSNIKYSNEKPISKQNINNIIKSLETICNFPPIKTMRDSFSKNHKYEIVAEETAKPASKKAGKPAVKPNTNAKPGKNKKDPDYDYGR
jgi:HEPN domain-containing protein